MTRDSGAIASPPSLAPQGRPLRAAALFVALVVSQPAARAEASWMPLQVGNRWQYVGTDSAHQTEVIVRTMTLRGREVFVKSYVEGPNAGLENYWLIGADGSVALCGYNRADFGVAYEPPLTLLAAPPALGRTWSTHTISYRLSDMTVHETFDIDWSVADEVMLQVPAGTYHCYAVGQVTPGVLLEPGPGRSFTLDGRPAPRTASTTALPVVITDWFAEDVGIVQYESDDLYRLLSFGNATPVRAFSWGRLKSRYR